MGKKKKADKKWKKKFGREVDAEQRSNIRTAEYLEHRFEDMADDLGDLIADMRSLGHLSEIHDISWCLMKFDELRKKYAGYSDHGFWEEAQQ